MRISDKQIQDLIRLYAQRTRQVREDEGARGRPEGAAAPRRHDVINLSARARELSRLRDVVAQLPDVRAERVDEIARAIREGTYSVEASEVAERILSLIEAERSG